MPLGHRSAGLVRLPDPVQRSLDRLSGHHQPGRSTRSAGPDYQSVGQTEPLTPVVAAQTPLGGQNGTLCPFPVDPLDRPRGDTAWWSPLSIDARSFVRSGLTTDVVQCRGRP